MKRLTCCSVLCIIFYCEIPSAKIRKRVRIGNPKTYRYVPKVVLRLRRTTTPPCPVASVAANGTCAVPPPPTFASVKRHDDATTASAARNVVPQNRTLGGPLRAGCTYAVRYYYIHVRFFFFFTILLLLFRFALAHTDPRRCFDGEARALAAVLATLVPADLGPRFPRVPITLAPVRR